MMRITKAGKVRDGGRDIVLSFEDYLPPEGESLRPPEIDFRTIRAVEFEEHPQFVVEFRAHDCQLEIWKRSPDPDAFHHRGHRVSGPLKEDIIVKCRVIGAPR